MEKFTSLEQAVETYPTHRYHIMTDEHADEVVVECIRDSAWAFRPEFLETMTEIPAAVYSLLGEQCENSNDAVLTLIEKTCGFDEFARQVVLIDGRGQFIAHYDGEEIEIQIDGQPHFVYRFD
jgi:sugar/nucleoside kinase (ribokinase family)